MAKLDGKKIHNKGEQSFDVSEYDFVRGYVSKILPKVLEAMKND